MYGGAKGRCKVLDVKLVGFSYSNKIDFHMKDFAPGLISKARVFETEKWLPRTQTSLSLDACKGRREGENGASPLVFHLSLIPCASSPVTRVSLAFRALLLCAKNETPEEEAREITYLVIA